MSNQVGDLVIVNNRGKRKNGKIIRIDKHRMLVVFGNNPVGVYYILNTLRCSENKNSDCHKITCVRKPRKGSAEARAIVAMLAKRLQLHYYDVYDYWMDNAINGDKKQAEKEYWHERKNGMFNGHDSFVCFQKAKSMLK